MTPELNRIVYNIINHLFSDSGDRDAWRDVEGFRMSYNWLLTYIGEYDESEFDGNERDEMTPYQCSTLKLIAKNKPQLIIKTCNEWLKQFYRANKSRGILIQVEKSGIRVHDRSWFDMP
jgi:3-methyladenine DNA glycosylase AlkD